MKIKDLIEKFRYGIYGVATGDALGGSVQFLRREEIRKNPVNGMESTRDYPKGTWSDDTSLTLALAESLGRCKKVNYEDIMDNFSLWLTKGKFTTDGRSWDEGYTCMTAIETWNDRKEIGWPEKAIDCGLRTFEDNGNGSLMRILPISFHIYAKYKENAYTHGDIIRNVSKLTHAHPISQFACEFYCNMIYQMIDNPTLSKSEIFNRTKAVMTNIWADETLKSDKEELRDVFAPLFDSDFDVLKEDDIKSSGYVVHSLEAAIWCFLNTDNFHDCILKAVNLGGDTDTIAAIAGGIAGIYYMDIPQIWIEELRGKEVIENSIADMISLL